MKARVTALDQRMLGLGIAAIVVSVLIVGTMWTRTSPYQPLYGVQERYDNAEILAVLDQEKISYQIDANSGQILVPTNRLADTRITLAARGVKAQLPLGLELLDSATGFGTSQFIESARYRQGIEGELARTILAINAVQHARVHLAIPQRTLFVGINEEKPSAAVMLELAPGQQLDLSQVEAIVNLVSGSVSGMENEGVSVIDQFGNLLSAELAMKNSGRMSARYHEMQQRIERDMGRRAADMIAPLVGIGNFRVQVAATLNFDEVEETHEAIDTEPVIRTEFTKQDSTQGQLALGIPGSLSNQAPADAQDTNANESRNERAEVSRQYDVGRRVRYTRQAQGGLETLSVSVLLNESVQGWEQAQLEQIAQMIKDAVGFTESRGDQFSLHAFNFAQPVSSASQEPMAWWQDPSILSLIQSGVYLLLGLSFILFVLRPLVKGLQRGNEVTAETIPALAAVSTELSAEQQMVEAMQQEALEEQEAEQAAPSPIVNLTKIDNEQDLADALLDAVGSAPVTPTEADELLTQMTPQQHGFELSDLPPAGSELEVQVRHLQKLTDVESERVAEVIRKWVSSND